MTTILPDPMTPEQRDAYYEARRLVDSWPRSVFASMMDSRTDEERALNFMHTILARRFVEATKPLEAMKARVLALDLDARVTLVLKDGLLERQDTEPSPEAKKALAALDELIAAEGRRFGIVVEQPHKTP